MKGIASGPANLSGGGFVRKGFCRDTYEADIYPFLPLNRKNRGANATDTCIYSHSGSGIIEKYSCFYAPAIRRMVEGH